MLIASNDEEDISAKDRINAEEAACEVALAITKLVLEGPIILKDFRAYMQYVLRNRKLYAFSSVILMRRNSYTF